MITRLATLAVLILTLSLAPAFAADETTETPSASLAWSSAAAPRLAAAPSRPAMLPVLYAGYAALQAYDVYSTRQALTRGATEANPLMQGAVSNTGAFVALKAGVTTGTILAAERLWKNNQKATAIGVMVASTAVSAIVASRNVRTLRQLR
jgi:hypothetical protein